MKRKTVIIIILILFISMSLFAKECEKMVKPYHNIFTENIERDSMQKIFDFQSIEDISRANHLPMDRVIEKLKDSFEVIDEKLSIRKMARENNISRTELKKIIRNVIDGFEKDDK